MNKKKIILGEFENEINHFLTTKNIKKIATEEAGFIDGAILLSNCRSSLGNQWEVTRDLFLKKAFPRYLPNQVLSPFSGAPSVLFGLNLLYGNDAASSPVYRKIVDRINGELVKTMYKLELNLENHTVNKSDYDIINGVSGLLNFILENEFTNSENIQVELVNYLLKVSSHDGREYVYLSHVVNDDLLNSYEKKLDCGVSHGIMGIYCVLSKFSERTNNIFLKAKVIMKLNEIETKLFTVDNDVSIKFPNPYLNNKGAESTEWKNLSWCYGISGYFSHIIKNANKEWSIFYKKELNLKKLLLNYLQNDSLYKTNPIVRSSTFCHGLAGLIYELNNVDPVFFGDEICSLLLRLSLIKQDNEIIFFDYQSNNSPYNFVDGSIGTWLVILSIINNKSFQGDYIFGK